MKEDIITKSNLLRNNNELIVIHCSQDNSFSLFLGFF